MRSSGRHCAGRDELPEQQTDCSCTIRARSSLVESCFDEHNRLPRDRGHSDVGGGWICAGLPTRSHCVADVDHRAFLAWHFSDLIAPHLGGLLAGSPVATWAARVIIVALLLLLGAGIGVAVAHFVRLSIFNGMDRFLGFVFGAFRGFVLLGVFVILGQLLRLDGEHWWRKSVLLPYGESIANGLRAVIGEERVRHASSGRPVSKA